MIELPFAGSERVDQVTENEADQHRQEHKQYERDLEFPEQ
jgi:hypothetical protein